MDVKNLSKNIIQLAMLTSKSLTSRSSKSKKTVVSEMNYNSNLLIEDEIKEKTKEIFEKEDDVYKGCNSEIQR
jgi:Calcium-activated chloride channel